MLETVFELPVCWGVDSPPHLADPLPQVNNRPRGVKCQPPHLGFAEVGMLFDSHFLLMQFLKYLQRDDLNVTAILIHISGVAKGVWGLNIPLAFRNFFKCTL